MKFKLEDVQKKLYITDVGMFVFEKTNDKDEYVGQVIEVDDKCNRVMVNNGGLLTELTIDGQVKCVGQKDDLTGELKEKKQ